jgi:hypothetical protein
MRTVTFKIVSLVIFMAAFSSCEKQTEEFEAEPIKEYLPLQSGKFITYRVDSTVFTNFGRVEELHSYHEKQIIDSMFNDNQGRLSYRVFRYTRDTLDVQPWQPAGTYFITPLTNTIEVVDNNQRVVKLANFIKEGNTWKGNHYLPNDPYSYKYNFSNDDNIGEWDFTMDEVAGTETINGKTYSDVVTITQADEVLNVPIVDPKSYASKTYSVEKYAKGIGLIYNELIMWEYQPNTGNTSGYKIGFGVKRSIIDHN